MKLARLRVAAPVLIALAIAPFRIAAAAPSTPTKAIERLDAALLDVMKNAKTLGYEGRYARLEPVVADVYDTPSMARIALGKHWKDLSDADRANFVKLFGRLTVANYAGRFTGWSGERFEVLSEEDGAQGLRLVRTRLVKPNGEPVNLDYRLRPDGDSWRIVDVFMNGTVSELALRRSEYVAVVDRDGYPALVAALEKKIAGLAAGQETDASAR